MAIVAAEEITRDWNLFRESTRRLKRERSRERENWRRYDATEYGQWNEQAVAQLIDEGRAPSTFNFSKRAVDVIAGSELADTQDVHFESEYGEKNTISIAMETLYKEDRELGAYLSEFTEWIRAGFIYRGWLECFKDRTRDPRGRVGYRYLSPDRMVVDPDWCTRRVNDNKQLFTTAWMTAEEIKDKWHKSSPEIEAAINVRKQLMGMNASGTMQEQNKVFDTSPESFDQQNGLFLVTSKIWLKRTPKQKLFDLEKSETLPDMEPEDMALFLESSRMMGRQIRVIEDTSTICMVKTFAPGLSFNLEIEKGEHPMQIGGYPYFAFSCDSINGRPNTPMDQLKDVQESLNKRESTITHILMTQSNNTLMVETDAVENPDQIQEMGKKTKRPGAVLEVNPDTNRMNKIKYLDRGNPPNDFLDSANHMRDMAHDLTPAVPAIQAASDTGDSGVLYQAKVAQAQVGMIIPKKNLKSSLNDIGNAWFLAARQIMTYPFNLSSPDGGWKFNVPGGIWMEEIPRMRVTITTSPTSDTFRRQLLQQYIAIKQYNRSALAGLRMESYVMKHLPNIPDAESKMIEADYDLEIKVATAQKLLELMTLNNQAQMAMGPQMPPGMPMGGGKPQGALPAPPSGGMGAVPGVAEVSAPGGMSMAGA